MDRLLIEINSTVSFQITNQIRDWNHRFLILVLNSKSVKMANSYSSNFW